MTKNESLGTVLGKIVEESLKSKKGKKSNGTKIGSRELNMPTKHIASFSY